MSEFRRSLWRQLDPSAYAHPGLSPVNKLVVALILIASMAAILETEPLIVRALPRSFAVLEQGLACAFLVEYAARLAAAFSDAFRRGSRTQHPYPRQGAETVRVGPAAMDGAR